MKSGVKFVEKVKEIAEIETNYRLAVMLGMQTPQVDNLINQGKYIKPEVLCKLRKISGLSWAKFGKMLDEEFGE